MIETRILALIRRRLTSALAPPSMPLSTLRVDGRVAGRFDAARGRRLAAFEDVFAPAPGGLAFVAALDTEPARTAALAEVAHVLASEGRLSAWRNERYAVGPGPGALPWFLLERAAARYFGVRSYAVHVNGLTGAAPAPLLWFARRAPGKAIDPGLLDNLVGGGVAHGQTIASTLVKEAEEEAGVAGARARAARPVGVLHLYRAPADGIQHETLFVHDLWLPASFAPRSRDGEVVEFLRMDLAAAAHLIARDSGPDVVTADASLVVLDCLMRLGAIAPDAPDYLALDALRHRSPDDAG